MVAWRRRSALPEDPLPWLYGVARRALAEQRRGALRRKRLGERLRREAIEETPGPELQDQELARALGCLSQGDREALLLRYWEELEPAQIAQAMGCSRATMAVRLHRARLRLRRELEAVDDQPQEDQTAPERVRDETGVSMITRNDIERRLRAARPATEVRCPPVSSLVRRIEQAAREPQPRRRLHRGGLALPVAIGVLAVAVASAGAALLLSSGQAVAPAFVLPATPAAGLGEPVPQSLALLPIRVADPDGGPPWGMRVIRTTRGLLCLQAGRVVDGRLGALGSGYAFDADKRFHPFLADDAIATDACPAVGAGRTAFLPGPPVIVPANGLPLAGENVSQSDQVHCDLPGQRNWGVRCPQSELRQVAVGLLGPHARSIAVSNADGSSFTIDPYGPEGAYLIVLPAQPDANASMSSGSYQGPFGYVSSAPGGATLRSPTTTASNARSRSPAPVSSVTHRAPPGGDSRRPAS